MNAHKAQAAGYKYWAVKEPGGYVNVLTYGLTHRRDDLASTFNDWPREYRRGYRLVRVRVAEVGP